MTIIIIVIGKSLENIPLQGLSCRCETMLNVHLREQGLRTWKENLICDILHKGDIVKAIMNIWLPSNIKKEILFQFSNYEILELHSILLLLLLLLLLSSSSSSISSPPYMRLNKHSRIQSGYIDPNTCPYTLAAT
jgi:hypothetical protein